MPLPRSILCSSCKKTYPEGWRRCPYCGHDETRLKQDSIARRFMQKKIRRVSLALFALLLAPAARADEARLILPDLDSVQFLGMTGRHLLLLGIVICALGFVFGLTIYAQLKKLPVHRSMLEVSELIYETCKTYLLTQGKFILLLEVFIGTIMVIYFGALRHFEAAKVIAILCKANLSLSTTRESSALRRMRVRPAPRDP